MTNVALDKRSPTSSPSSSAPSRERGLPVAIRSDNGPPFASARLGGLSAFAVHLVKLGITPERIAPGHPEQNGRLERFHRTLKEAVMSPPASRYAPSPRPYPGKVESPEYAEGVEVRRVRSNVEIKWAGERVFVSEALIGEPVGLVRHGDRLWTVRFGHLEIGRLDGYALRIIKMPVKAFTHVSGLALPMPSVGQRGGFPRKRESCGAVGMGRRGYAPSVALGRRIDSCLRRNDGRVGNDGEGGE